MINPFCITTIAGSDNSAGAGIQNDIRTATLLGGYATTVITAVTVQSPDKFYETHTIPSEIIAQQLRTILESFPIKAIKTGMLHLDSHSLAIAEILKKYPYIPLIIDPIWKSTSGGSLTSNFQITKEKLFPLSTLITPNRLEAEALTGFKIETLENVIKAGKEILTYGTKAVLIKGGHRNEFSDKIEDILITPDGYFIFENERLPFDVRGTGCRLATAIACFLAQNFSLKDAIHNARNFLFSSMQKSFEVQNKRVII